MHESKTDCDSTLDDAPLQDPEIIAMKHHIGLDAKGRDHYFDPYRDDVYVLDGNTVVHYQAVAPGEVSRWVAFVRENTGWESNHYHGGTLMGVDTNPTA